MHQPREVFMVYLLWAPALAAALSVAFGFGVAIGKARQGDYRTETTLALPEIGYPALPLRPLRR
jgi:hypothetical protein